jgi:muramoyltetrapeptide carboxypeptidase
LNNSNHIRPPKLQIGDTIGIVSPASPCYGDKKQKLERGIQHLQSKGYKIKLGQFVRKEFGYLAGKDNERLSDLSSMFQDPAVKAIFVSRGGFGTSRLLDQLDYASIQKNPKIFMGYSDITAIQCALLKKCNIVSFSGPMVAPEFGDNINPKTDLYCWDILTRSQTFSFGPEIFGLTPKVYNSGTALGQLICGNLSVICSLLGTGYLPSFKNAILVLEDVGEDVYKIDRFLNQLKLAGVFEQLNGLVLGQFTFCENGLDSKSPSFPIEHVFDEYFSNLTIPVMGNFPYGHDKKKFTLPMGIKVELDSTHGILKMLEPGVLNE